MQIELTDKTNAYINKRDRLNYIGLAWLGVINYGGHKGQLAYNMATSRYIMLSSGSVTIELDTATVNAALLVAKPRKPGRKPMDKPAKEPRQVAMIKCLVSLTQAQIDKARATGSGNLSLGVRECINKS